MLLNEVYFWTDTVKDWKPLLANDAYKTLLINELRSLTDKGMIAVYGFVLMPNHIHLIWELLKMNGKEKPHASFNKYTSHEMVKHLKANQPHQLEKYEVEETDRQYRIWQRDPLAVRMNSKSKCSQKLNYIHKNPLQDHWNLATREEQYPWSSAGFYLTGKDDFGFLTHYTERFG
jgi:REP element-mobilizing transposase RayT